jgi:hypothetical protein
MHIPYDLEFVENRPTVAFRAITLAPPQAATHGERSSHRPDAIDRLLYWAFRVLRRFESRN